ncbi:alginate O-acetyltransferase AlgX-related protein, partial [Bordetella avium]
MSEQSPDLPAPPPTSHATVLNQRASLLAGLVLLIFMIVGVASNAWWTWGEDHAVLPEDVSLSRVLDGGVTHDLSERLADMPFSSEAARLQRGLGWLTLGDLGARVRQGCPGWLFLSDELELHRGADANAQARAHLVAQVREALAAQGVGLLVAVVPDKSRIEAEHLCGLRRPAVLQDRVTRWIDDLRAKGVTAIDLTSPLQTLGKDAYYRNDTHWNEAGAGVAARAVADAIRASGVPLQPPRT